MRGTEEVLCEQPAGRDGRFLGHGTNYAEVLADGSDLRDQLRRVRKTGVEDGALRGTIIEE